MGWVPPPAPPLHDVEGRRRHRAMLVQALGYEPTVDRKPRFQTLRFIRRALARS